MATNGESPLRTRLRLWTTSPRPARGPAPSYTREQIADAAIAIADSEGLDAVTMRRVATELGTGAMSLYRYVANKESLIELVADRMYARQEWPEPTGRWRRDLRKLAHAYRDVLRAHPWLLRVWGSRPVLGPNALRYFERSLELVDGLGLDIDEMMETVLLVGTWTVGHVRQELDLAEVFGAEPDAEEAERALDAYVRKIADSGEYPYFTRFVTESLLSRLDAEALFDRALDRLLTGIEATVADRGGTRS
ncbi:TetR/AcrR family transcriptional regulator [Saccharomonospora glauca]|nr:TetR/AcrR family transcriptional regulator [Saccharomonospora glauca]